MKQKYTKIYNRIRYDTGKEIQNTNDIKIQ